MTFRLVMAKTNRPGKFTRSLDFCSSRAAAQRKGVKFEFLLLTYRVVHSRLTGPQR